MGSEKSELEVLLSQRLKLDFHFLQCPICFQPFTPPVFQCKNGHTTCSSFCAKTIQGCRSCPEPTGRIRNIAVEKIIESLEVACKNVPYGCKTMVKYTDIKNHETDLCEFKPIPCPVLHPECLHVGSKVTRPLHLKEKHKLRIVKIPGSVRSVSFRMKLSDETVLLEGHDALVFVHCGGGKFDGSYHWCSSFGTSKAVAYSLSVQPVMLNKKTSGIYKLKAVAPFHYFPRKDWNFEYIIVPNKTDEFDMTVSLK